MYHLCLSFHLHMSLYSDVTSCCYGRALAPQVKRSLQELAYTPRSTIYDWTLPGPYVPLPYAPDARDYELDAVLLLPGPYVPLPHARDGLGAGYDLTCTAHPLAHAY